MYRHKIRDYYDRLSRSYRSVADFVLSNYYEVSFMTAAQLAFAVGVDTTTVVRFSQRIGYNGYPELLHDIRAQVKAEIYAAYVPQPVQPDDPVGIFRAVTELEADNLKRLQAYNPPGHIEQVTRMLDAAQAIMIIAEGYAMPLAELVAQQFRHLGIAAYGVGSDPTRLAGALTALTPQTLLIGISGTDYGRDVARAMQYARSRGCATLGIIGDLSSPVNLMADLIIYTPSDAVGPLASMVALMAALGAIVALGGRATSEAADRRAENVAQAFAFLTQPDAPIPDDE
jgi:DNA-binding MurR/RpiR family transcriptional regulator